MKAEIEVVPCKICSDKSSGVHYGVITCEGCKGFFRRSQTAARPFECQGNQNCNIDRANRNRCQYCRWKKCIELGMSRDAVKFGRMSKKQREKVEGEVNLHKQLKGRSSSKDGTVKVESDVKMEYQNGHFSNGSTEQVLQETSVMVKGDNCMMHVSNGTTSGYAAYSQNSLSPVSSGYSSSHTSSPTPSNSQPGLNGSVNTTRTLSETTSIGGHDDIASGSPDSGSLVKLLLTAHEQTSLYTREQIQQLKMVVLDYETVWKYKNMGKEAWWSHGASELTPMLQQIVEFAKLIPCFMTLSQDDQIVLLKGGAMEVAIIRMSTMYDLNTHTILYGGVYVPANIFQSNDQVEGKFVYDLFLFLREVSSYNLTETEIAIYSAMVLMWPHRTSLKNAEGIHVVYQRLLESLEMQLRSSHGNHNAVLLFNRLTILIGNLQNIAAQHAFILGQFMASCPDVALPPLYKEIFTTDHH